MNKALQRSSSVNLRTLQLVRRNIHQHTGSDQHLVRNTDPDIDQDDHYVCPSGSGQKRNITGADRADISQPLGNSRIGTDCVHDTVVSEEVTYQKQGNELGNCDRYNEQRSPQLRQLRSLIIDQQGQQDTAKVSGKGCEQCPYQCPDQNLTESITEGNGHSTVGEQILEIGKSHPCKQCGGRHMSLIIVRKRNSDQNQQRNDRENNDTHDRKCQQCDIEFVILELLQVFYKRIDMFSCLCFFLKPVNSHFILKPDHQEREPDNK